jgi:hypothetical protein
MQGSVNSFGAYPKTNCWLLFMRTNAPNPQHVARRLALCFVWTAEGPAEVEIVDYH